MKTHVFNTWILAHGLHPFTIAGMAILRGIPASESMDEIGIMIFFSLVAMLFAIPGLFVSWCVMSGVVRSKSSLQNRFFLWLVSGCVITTVNAMMPFAFFGLINLDDLKIILPAVTATFLSICIRFKPFVRLAVQHDEPEELKLN